jgi:hypothetical protein
VITDKTLTEKSLAVVAEVLAGDEVARIRCFSIAPDYTVKFDDDSIDRWVNLNSLERLPGSLEDVDVDKWKVSRSVTRELRRRRWFALLPTEC